MNRKGGEKLLSIWWFFILAVTAAAIAVAVVYFYSADIDVRGVEADVLGEKLLQCINRDGFLVKGFILDGFDIYSACDLNNETFGRDSRLYFNVTFEDSSGKKIKGIRGGDSAYEESCRIVLGGNVEAARYPRCVSKLEKVSYIEKEEEKEGYILILAASNQYAETITAK